MTLCYLKLNLSIALLLTSSFDECRSTFIVKKIILASQFLKVTEFFEDSETSTIIALNTPLFTIFKVCVKIHFVDVFAIETVHVIM